MHEFAVYETEPGFTFKIIPNRTVYNGTQNINQLIQNRIQSNKRFFGMEISPSPKGKDLDFNNFGENQPLFTSITWLFDHNINYDPMSLSPALQLAKSVKKSNPILMHLTCYKLTEQKLNQILADDVTNFLALRGGLFNNSILLMKQTIKL